MATHVLNDNVFVAQRNTVLLVRIPWFSFEQYASVYMESEECRHETKLFGDVQFHGTIPTVDLDDFQLRAAWTFANR